MSEQWKEKGDCKTCKKKGKCAHSCAAHKRRTGAEDTRIKYREVIYGMVGV